MLTGIVLSFYFMWPFALLSIACVPFMAMATSVEMKVMYGEDEGDDNAKEEVGSPGGIIVETLLNIGTVSALTLEEERFRLFEEALNATDENYVRAGLHQGALSGFSMFVQQWINGLQFWFGGWLLFKYPETYSFDDFLISIFAMLFALFGLGAAFQDVSDRKQTEMSASRVFYLLDKQSEIDPLSEDGKTVDYAAKLKLKKKKSVRKLKKNKLASSLKDVEEEDPAIMEAGDEDVKKSSSSLKGKKSKQSKKKVIDEEEEDDEKEVVEVDEEDKPKKPKSKKKKKKKKVTP